MTDWNAEAQRAVAHVEAELSEAHRGAFLWHEPSGVVVIFNNGLEDEPVPAKQKEFLEQALGLKKATIHAVAESDDRSIWAMLVTGVDPDWAFDCAWAAWHSAHSQVDPGQYEPLSLKAFLERGDLPLDVVSRYQCDLAKKTIEAHYSDPRHWKSCRPDGWTFEGPVCSSYCALLTLVAVTGLSAIGTITISQLNFDQAATTSPQQQCTALR